MSKEALMSTPQNRAIEREKNNGLSLPQDHDRVLVERVLTGDQEAMIALFDRYSHLVYSFALRSTGTPELAETVLHEVFLRLWRTPGQCTPVPGSGIATWLKGCVQSNLASPSAPPARTLTNNPKMLKGTGLEVLELEDEAAFFGRRMRMHSAPTQLAAMQSLAQAFVENPDTILQALVEAAVDICGAQSSGISIQNQDPNGTISYHWVATAGQYRRFANAMLPSFPSACGVCLERGRPQFFRVSQTFFDLMGIEAEVVTDGLLIPWQVEETRGTVWVMSHDREEVFDTEDCRMMVLLASFAAMGVRHQRQQKALIDHAKAAAAAEMANRLAHAINNPLQILTSALFLAENDTKASEDRALAQALSGPLERLIVVVKSILTVSSGAGAS
jgi:DNA-directed RNA polymerase specialized sigma24 family protein